MRTNKLIKWWDLTNNLEEHQKKGFERQTIGVEINYKKNYIQSIIISKFIY